MGLFRRMRNILAANLNELTEQYENPEKLLKQAIREMEAAIAQATQETAKAMTSQKLLAKELARNGQQARAWQERAQKAVEAGDEDLARKALARKREHEKLVTALQDQFQAAEEASRSLRNQLGGMRAKLEEARRSLATLAARQRAAEFRKKLETSTRDVGFTADDNAFAQFDRLREKVERAEAEAEALAELGRAGGGPAVPEAEADQDDLLIEAQLQELKRKKAP